MNFPTSNWWSDAVRGIKHAQIGAGGREFDMREEHYASYEDMFRLYARYETVRRELASVDELDYIGGGAPLIDGVAVALSLRFTKKGVPVFDTTMHRSFIGAKGQPIDTTKTGIIAPGDEKHPSDDPTTITFDNIRKWIVKAEHIIDGTFEFRKMYSDLHAHLSYDEIQTMCEAAQALQKKLPGVSITDVALYLNGLESSFDKNY